MNKTAYALPATLFTVISWSSAVVGADNPASENAAHQTLDAWVSESNEQWQVLGKYCMDCHNSSDWAGGVAFDVLALEELDKDAAIWEEAVRKLRAGMMPPQGAPRP